MIPIRLKARPHPQGHLRPLRFLPDWRLVAAYIVLMAIGFYAVAIEPFWIQVSHFRLSAAVMAPLRIAQISDLHTQGLRLREQKLLRLLEQEKPDAIFVTGDSIVDGSSYARVAEVLSRLKAPLGVWVVRGNWENALRINSRLIWGKRALDEAGFYAGLGVHLLVNRGELLREDIWIFGVDEVTRGKPDLEAALGGAPPGAFKIALFHVPSFFDAVAGRAQLAMAGHCHGGQIRLPWMPPFYLPAGCGKYVAGWYQKMGSRMYVSRGLGNSLLDMRLFSRPELVILDLVPR